MVTVIYACGCADKVPDARTGGEPPICVAHQRGVSRVTSRPPSIVGCATGPHVQTKALDPATPTLTQPGHGALVLKPMDAKESRHGG